MTKTVNIPVGKFSVAAAIKEIKKHAVGRNLQDIIFNPINLLNGTLEIRTEEPQVVEIEKIVEKLIEVPIEKIIEKEGPLKVVSVIKKQRGATSQYRGVCKKGHKWYAMIQHDGKKHWCGSYFHEMEAAEAYDRKAFELKGIEAILNFSENYIEKAAN